MTDGSPSFLGNRDPLRKIRLLSSEKALKHYQILVTRALYDGINDFLEESDADKRFDFQF